METRLKLVPAGLSGDLSPQYAFERTDVPPRPNRLVMMPGACALVADATQKPKKGEYWVSP